MFLLLVILMQKWYFGPLHEELLVTDIKSRINWKYKQSNQQPIQMILKWT